MSLIRKMLFAVALAVSGVVWAAPVDINTADAKTLETLNGIGAAKAQAIVAYRTANGPFKSVEDLTKVDGVGDKIVEANRGNLTVGATKAPAKKNRP
jgi:competence protein ComEA